MIQAQKPALKSYFPSVLLIGSVIAGAGLGLVFGEKTLAVKPLGDVFLNLLFTAVVPLVFFSISSAVAGMPDIRRLGRILSLMLLVFVVTGMISSALMLAGVKLYPPVLAAGPATGPLPEMSGPRNAVGILRAFTVSDFSDLLSRRNMLALIVFAFLTGLGTLSAGEKGRPFAGFLLSANEVMMKVMGLIMLYAPVGLAAYFACLAGAFGPQLFGAYGRAVALYYPVAFFYFFAGFTVYAGLAAGRAGITAFWRNILPPSLTALGTGSSLAAVPANLEAADRIGIPKDVSRLVIPVGATIHMDGSCLAAVLKISLLFGFFGMDFSGPGTLAMTAGIALLSGVVISGIPSGGLLGEMLIITLFGFPPEALPMISMIGTLVDSPATLVNSVGDNAVGMMIARILGGPGWMRNT